MVNFDSGFLVDLFVAPPALELCCILVNVIASAYN